MSLLLCNQSIIVYFSDIIYMKIIAYFLIEIIFIILLIFSLLLFSPPPPPPPFLFSSITNHDYNDYPTTVCLIYVERLMEQAHVPLVGSTWRPVLLCGLLLASKVWQDLRYNNNIIIRHIIKITQFVWTFFFTPIFYYWNISHVYIDGGNVFVVLILWRETIFKYWYDILFVII